MLITVIALISQYYFIKGYHIIFYTKKTFYKLNLHILHSEQVAGFHATSQQNGFTEVLQDYWQTFVQMEMYWDILGVI